MHTAWIRILWSAAISLWGAVTWPGLAFAQPVTYNVVTDEVTAASAGGPSASVYRFAPAVYVVNQGDDVTLAIRGVKGHDHPVELEGYGLHAVVRRGQVTRLQFKADKAGIFRLICTAHADATHKGPMEGYLVVVPRYTKTHAAGTSVSAGLR
jgi:plastocyanin